MLVTQWKVLAKGEHILHNTEKNKHHMPASFYITFNVLYAQLRNTCTFNILSNSDRCLHDHHFIEQDFFLNPSKLCMKERDK